MVPEEGVPRVSEPWVQRILRCGEGTMGRGGHHRLTVMSWLYAIGLVQGSKKLLTLTWQGLDGLEDTSGGRVQVAWECVPCYPPSAIQRPRGRLLPPRGDMDLRCGGPCGNNDDVLLEGSIGEEQPGRWKYVPLGLRRSSIMTQSHRRSGCGDALVCYQEETGFHQRRQRPCLH